jgi:hypothetical protein
MTWCCSLLRDLFETADVRGLGIFARSDIRGSVFVLQARSGDDPSIDGWLAEEVVIRFCPGCGGELLVAYGQNIADYLRDDLTIHTEL